MIKSIVNIKPVKPKRPFGIKAIGISYPQKVALKDFILLQDILNYNELKKVIINNSSITIKNYENKLITENFDGIYNYLDNTENSSTELISINFSKSLLKEIALKYNIKDYRLIVSGFDPFFKIRDKNNFKNEMLAFSMGLNPYIDVGSSLSNALYNAIEKNFGSESLYFLPQNENITNLMKNAYNSLKKRLNIKNLKISEFIISTYTPYNIYKGSNGFIHSSNSEEIDKNFDLISVSELHECCVGFLQILKLAVLLSENNYGENIIGVTGDALASISGSDWKCRGLSSDAATATLFGECENNHGILGVGIFNIPKIHNIITQDKLTGSLIMDGSSIQKVIEECYPKLVTHAINTFEFDRKKVKIISHQMNGVIISKLHMILNKNKPEGEPDIKQEQILNVFKQYGNSSSSTVPTALYQALCDNKIKKGDEVIFIALGSGFNMGYVGYRVNEDLVGFFYNDY